MKKMNSFPHITIIAMAGTLFMSANAANARPYLYLDTFSHGASHQKCIAGAKKVLLENGFKNLDNFEQPENRESEVSGYHKNEAMTATIECDQKLGTTTMAVSGLDNTSTYKMYKILFNAEW